MLNSLVFQICLIRARQFTKSYITPRRKISVSNGLNFTSILKLFCPLQINWFVFCPASSLLVVSSTKSTSALQLFNLKSGGIYKLPKIDLAGDNSKVEVKEKDVHGM